MTPTRRAVCASLLMSLATRGWSAAPWPSRPVRVVVPFAPGGGTDIVARALGSALSAQFKQPVVIENRPGASTIIGADAVAKADGDEPVLLLSGSTTFTVNPALRTKLPYNSSQDLALIGMVARAPLVLVVQAGAPWKTFGELMAAGKAKPGSLAYATFGPGSGSQLSGALLALEAGTQWLEVPYKGSAPALTDLLGGQLQFAIDTIASAGPQIKAGKLRALVVLGTSRASALPDVPSLTDVKMPGAAFDAWYALAAPGRLPTATRAQLEHWLQAAVADPAAQATIRQQSMEPVFIGSAALRPLAEQEIARYRMLAHRARIVVD